MAAAKICLRPLANKIPTVADRLQNYFEELERLIPNPPRDWEKTAKPCRWAKLLEEQKKQMAEKKKPGLYANINAKRERIAEGSGEKMRKPGEKGAPTAKAFKESAKTAKKPKKK